VSRLRIFSDGNPSAPRWATGEPGEIRDTLAQIGVLFERWQTSRRVHPGAAAEQIIDAFREDVDRLVAARGFRSIDVVSITPADPQREVMRSKFLQEHFHEEDEVRFFVAGSGLFSLHVDDQVYEVLCEAGDLIAVPDRVCHWFDMGPQPSFVAIRFFTQPEGWVGHFTGTDIADKFPRYDEGPAAR